MEPNFPGAFISPLDPRDFRVTALQAELDIPVAYKTDLSQVPVLYQNGRGACTAHAVVAGVMATGDTEIKDESPRFLYSLAKQEDGIPGFEGTYLRVVLKKLQEKGVCDNAQFPNNIHLSEADYKDVSQITQEAYDAAIERKIKSYARVDNLSFAGLKQAIFQNKVVIAVVRWENQPGPHVKIVNPNTNVWHAICLYGYEDDKIWFRNSFGKDWGQSGNGYFDEEYLPHVAEAWTFIDLPDLFIKGLKSRLTLLQTALGLALKLLSLLKGRNQ